MIDGMAGIVVAAAAWAAVTGVAATFAYRAGRRAARRPFPAPLRDDLMRHKRDCLREPAERVARELDLYLGPAHRDAPSVPRAGGHDAAAPASAPSSSATDGAPAAAHDDHNASGRRHTGAA